LGFDVTNQSDHPVNIPNFMLLEVQTQTNERFFAQWGPSGHDQYIGFFESADSKHLEIPSGKTITFEFPINSRLTAPECFYDYRLTFPGTYHLRVILDPEPNAKYLGEHSLPKRKEMNGLSERVLSNQATLIIETPAKDDAIVWNRMLERTDGKGWSGSEWSSYGFNMAKEIWKNHKASSYIPYIVAGVPSLPEERISNYELVLSMNSTHRMAPFLHRGLAEIYSDLSFYELNVRKSTETAKEYFEKSQKHLNSLIQLTDNSEMVREAKEMLDEKWEARLQASRELDGRKE
jgi:hypothetical protein